LALCQQIEPQVILTELQGPTLDGLKFVRTLRRSALSCRTVPVIVITATPTASAIIAARNCGVHEFLCKPYTIRDLSRRLEAVALHGRDWIEAVNYVGPDRRRFNSGDYRGPRKRHADNGIQGVVARIEQALRILASAIRAIDADPAQALRSMQAQAADLNAIATQENDVGLMAGTAALQRCLAAAAASGVVSRAAIEGGAAELLALLPSDKDSVPQRSAAA
jgi:DNA-binding response OmpR family regulator